MGMNQTQEFHEKKHQNVKTTFIESYELKESREGHLVPSINGVHLHSTYNPLREADVFIDKNIKTLESKNEILLLGLGLGYHLVQIVDFLENKYGQNYRVFVIEPVQKLFDDSQRLNILPQSKSVYYYTTDSLSKLYSQKEILDFLVQKPGIIIHTPSFNFNRAFFEGFLSYRVNQELKTIKDLPIKPEILSYLSHFDENSTLREVTEETRRKDQINELDQLLLALQSFRKKESKDPNLCS